MKQIAIDVFHICIPPSAAFSVVTLGQLRDVAAIISYGIAAACSIWVAYHKTRK